MKSMRYRTTMLAFAVLAFAMSFTASAAPTTEPIKDVATVHAVNQAYKANVKETANASIVLVNVRADIRASVIHLAASDAPTPDMGRPSTMAADCVDLVCASRLPLPDNLRRPTPTPDMGLSLS